MPADSTITKYAKSLQNCYVGLYAEKYNKAPVMNSHRDLWGFKSMYSDLGEKRAQQVIEFYFNTGKLGHPLQYLLYNYDKLHKTLAEIEQDEIKRLKIRQQTAQRVREWEAKHGNG